MDHKSPAATATDPVNSAVVTAVKEVSHDIVPVIAVSTPLTLSVIVTASLVPTVVPVVFEKISLVIVPAFGTYNFAFPDSVVSSPRFAHDT